MVNKRNRRWLSPQGAAAVGNAVFSMVMIGVVLAGIWVFSGCSNDAESADEDVDSIEELIGELASQDDVVREEAVRALVKMDREAIGPLVEAVRSQDEMVCKTACFALSEIGEHAVYPLASSLHAGEIRWPHYAAWALARMGPHGCEYTGLVLAALEAGDSNLRSMAALALGTIAPQVAIVNPAWREAMKLKHSGICISSSKVLLASRNATDDLLAASVAALDDDATIVRINAVLAFIALGPEAQQAVPRLEVLTKDPVPKLRKYAHIALARVEPTEQRILTLVKLLTDIEANTVEVCEAGLKAMGADTRPFVPAIVRGLQDESSDVRLRAAMAEALGHIGSNAQDAVFALGAATDSPHGIIRRNAVRSLGRIGPAARPMIPKIVRFLRDRDAGMREWAEKALEQIGR